METVATDSIFVTDNTAPLTTEGGTGEDTLVTTHQHVRLTPYQVLRSLPKDATPAQQDSAIQAMFQPGEIHYSNRPDTLHLPGHGIGRNLRDVSLPQYYREHFFQNSALLKEELGSGRLGVAGDPIPYNAGNDNVIASMLLVSTMLSLIFFAQIQRLWLHYAKDFFNPAKQKTNFTESASVIRLEFFYVIQTALLLALVQFFYVQTYVANTFILDDEKMLIAIYWLIIMAYFAVKAVLYSWVNKVFFPGKKNEQWLKCLLFLISFEGLLLWPVVVTYAFFDISLQGVIIYTIFVVIIVKILTFYKGFVIFFKQNVLNVQIFLYFCALEIIPLLTLWGGLAVITNALQIIF